MVLEELFTLIKAADAGGDGVKKKFNMNLNRNRIRSISAYSSNSIFYFTTVVSDQITSEEMGMCARFLEKSYASFVVACFGLMPFHRIKADDQASIEEYLRQFHQNMGIRGSGNAVARIMGFVNTLEESVADIPVTKEEIAATQDFLLECWDKSRAQCGDFIKLVVENVQPLNKVYNVDAVDPVTRTLTEAYRAKMEELETWGFIGEATVTMLDTFDDDTNVSDEDLINAALGIYHGNDDDLDDLDDDIDEDDLDDDLLDETSKQRSALSEGNVKQAINSVMFQLQAVSENKILSCSSLTKLNALEAKLNKLKGKYARYLTRYKKKYYENRKKDSNSKLSIRFNGMMISDPKAFMQQYGSYIKIINKRLKLVEKRRAELRKRKGLPDVAEDKRLEEAGMPVLTESDLSSVDMLIEAADAQLDAPDGEAFLVEAKVTMDSKDYQKLVNERDSEKRRADQAESDLKATAADWRDAENRAREAKERERMATDYAKDMEYQAGREARAKEHVVKNAGQQETKINAQRSRIQALEREVDQRKAEGKEFASTQRELERANKEYQRQIAALGKYRKNPDTYDPGEGITWDSRRPQSGANLAAAAAAGYRGHKTFDKEIFTDMDMKKSNEAVPTFAKATIGFVVDETEQVIERDVLVGIKVWVHKVPARELVSDIYNALINKRGFLKFVKYVSGEEKSLADLLFGIKELRTDATATRNQGVGQWLPAMRRRKRWSNMSVPYLMRNYTPNGTIVVTMNEVNYIRDEYGIDIMRDDHVRMIMDQSFLLGFVVLDQANEIVYVSYDGHGGKFEQYTYAMLEREQATSDRMMRELYRSMAR